MVLCCRCKLVTLLYGLPIGSLFLQQVPKRKPKLLKTSQEDEKPGPAPKKFVAFSLHDSRAVETAYQALADEFDDPRKETNHSADGGIEKRQATDIRKPRTSVPEGEPDDGHASKVKVPVHEDFLFEVDIEKRELSPVYWLGPIYEVRRGR